jgi:hypothetical protein
MTGLPIVENLGFPYLCRGEPKPCGKTGHFGRFVGGGSGKDVGVELDKDTIVNFIRDRMGDRDKSERARQELPDKVDTDKDAGLLDRFGIDPSDLMGKLKDLPGVSGLFGDKKD